MGEPKTFKSEVDDDDGSVREFDSATVNVVRIPKEGGKSSVLIETWPGDVTNRRTNRAPTYAALKSIKNEDVRCVAIDPDRVECSPAVNEIIALTVTAKLTQEGFSPHFVQSYATMSCAGLNSNYTLMWREPHFAYAP